jgi:hypothetical protein
MNGIMIVIMLNGIIDVCHHAEWHYAEWHYAEWHYAEWHYTECRGTFVDYCRFL